MLIKKNMINITTISNALKNTINQSFRAPANLISTIIMLCAVVRRPGLSCIISTNNIIQNMAKHGLPTERLPDGSENKMNILVQDIVCEIFRALKEDANIQIAVPPGALAISATGASAVGPVTVVGTNITGGKGVGLLQ